MYGDKYLSNVKHYSLAGPCHKQGKLGIRCSSLRPPTLSHIYRGFSSRIIRANIYPISMQHRNSVLYFLCFRPVEEFLASSCKKTAIASVERCLMKARNFYLRFLNIRGAQISKTDRVVNGLLIFSRND